MKKRKTIYLVKSSAQTSAPLVEVSSKEWFEIVTANNTLSNEERRYFITDSITENGFADRIVIEVSKAEYKMWDAERKLYVRNSIKKKEYEIVSFENAEVEGTPLAEILVSDEDVSDMKSYDELLCELRAALAEWKSWGPELLDKYINHERKHLSAWLAEQCGVTEKQSRIYRKRFEEFVKKFLR